MRAALYAAYNRRAMKRAMPTVAVIGFVIIGAWLVFVFALPLFANVFVGVSVPLPSPAIIVRVLIAFVLLVLIAAVLYRTRRSRSRGAP